MNNKWKNHNRFIKIRKHRKKWHKVLENVNQDGTCMRSKEKDNEFDNVVQEGTSNKCDDVVEEGIS